jgi:hypothetical protein
MASGGGKKNMDSARRFLWEEDETPRSRSSASTSTAAGRGFSTRDYAVDQSVNLMAMDDGGNAVDVISTRSSTGAGATRLSQSIAGLFRGGTEGSGVGGTGKSFDEYGDAAASADAEEYISDKRRRVTPLWSICAASCGSIFDSCLITCGRFGLSGLRLVLCVGLGLGLLGVGLYFIVSGSNGGSTSAPISGGDQRLMNIKTRIVQAEVTPQDVFESKKSSPQKSALLWLAHEDPAALPFDHPALLDRYTLAVFYYSSTNAQKSLVQGGWARAENWMTEKGICVWYGIECKPMDLGAATQNYNGNGRITAILLSNNNIEGVIPNEIGLALDQLINLDLQQNKLSQSIPTTLGMLPQLRNFLVGENEMVGSLPSEIGSATNLHQLNLAKNGFTGSIPETWSALTELRNLAVANNKLTGTFPDLSKMTRMLGLFLEDNTFEGPLPEWLGTLTALCKFKIGEFTNVEPNLYEQMHRPPHTVAANVFFLQSGLEDEQK